MSRIEPKPGHPYGWIQWKGTSVCMDIWCACGNHGHIDAEFAYYIECAKCGQVYWTGQNVTLHPMTRDEATEVMDRVIRTEHNDE